MRSANLSMALQLGVLLPLAALAGSCTQGKSYILVTLTAEKEPIPGVASVRLALTASGVYDELTYVAKPGPVLEITSLDPTTMSVSFSDSFTGTATLSATPLAANGAPLGYGENKKVQIASGRIAYATVVVAKGVLPPVGDGGVRDGGTGDGDGGGDAGLLKCSPASTTECGPNATCGVSCLQSAPTSKCVAGGIVQPGEVCTGEGQCASGSQCFRSSLSCGVSTCRRFCSTNAECGAGTCFTEITCGMPPIGSGVRTCSQPCDPRGAATTGCAMGLRCFLFPGEVADCDCGSPKRIASDGAICVDSGDCMTGLLCVTMQGASLCRPICKLSETTTCASDRWCEKLLNPAYEVFGACVPK